MPHDFPTTPAAALVYLVFFTDSGSACLEAYADKNHAERAAAHYKRRGFADTRIDARAIRGETFLTMIGA
jgi:hypothetical protein